VSIARSLKQPATLCALLLGLCTLLSFPFVEMGVNDDFAYIRSAKALAETGHILYFGWSSAMLGWQLALGALFIKLFGFSFAAARASIFLVALATAWLLQRTFVHLGLHENNATFATLTLILSPLFIPLSFSFMSDIPGLFAIVLSLYLCLRAIETQPPSDTTTWLIAAAIASAVLGTARQTGWLGILAIVPSACWMLRRRRLPFQFLAAIWLFCAAFIFACMHWFNHQMYATTENSNGMGVDRDHLYNMGITALRVPLEIAFFLSPIFIAFVTPFFQRSRRLCCFAMFAAIAFFAYFLLRPHSYWIGNVLAPANSGIGNYVTGRGILELPEIGERPVVLAPMLRAIVSVVSYFSAFAFVALLATAIRNRKPGPTSDTEMQSWPHLLILLGPLTLAYCAFLSLRVFSGQMFDRYLLPLLMVVALVAVRFYQDRIGPRIPGICYAVLVLFAAVAVAGNHDMFVAERARLAAIQQLRAAGLPSTAFYGGFAYDGWTQIDQQGYIDVDDIRTPTGIQHLSEARSKFKPCGYWSAKFYPTIQPQYALSYDNSTCDPQNKFAPVLYHLWLPPFSGAIYTRGVSPERLAQTAP